MEDLEFLNWCKNLFESAPEEQWTVGKRTDLETGKHCALGWLDKEDPVEGLSNRLIELSYKSVGMSFEEIWTPCPIVEANNGDSQKYTQKTPKARTLACLEDLIVIASKV